jgi:hypothetical protein
MQRQSPDAARIMALPFAHHPRLAAFVAKLAGNPKVTIHDAIELLDAACLSAKISMLDLEMVQPGTQNAVPFEGRSVSPADDHQQAVSRHVGRLLSIVGGKA